MSLKIFWADLIFFATAFLPEATINGFWSSEAEKRSKKKNVAQACFVRSQSLLQKLRLISYPDLTVFYTWPWEV